MRGGYDSRPVQSGDSQTTKIKHCQTGSGYTSYKVYSRTASFPGRRLFGREKRQRRCRKESAEMTKAEEKRTETMIDQLNRKEATEVMEFVEILDDNEKKEFLAFLQGARFAKNMSSETIKTA